jgi:hypothetical protein
MKIKKELQLLRVLKLMRKSKAPIPYDGSSNFSSSFVFEKGAVSHPTVEIMGIFRS